jgi:UDP-N-acetylglucosamine 2-epimerase (non-hydrolysing)
MRYRTYFFTYYLRFKLYSKLGKSKIFTKPLEFLDLIKKMSISNKVISDSGGIQEEAPTFKVPVLILRETTERPEAVDIGISKLVGMNKEEIIKAFNNFNPKFDLEAKNPYGDGNSSKRIVELLK